MEKKIQIIVVIVVVIVIISAFFWFNEANIDPLGDPDKDGLTNEQEKELNSDRNNMNLFIEVDFLDGYEFPYVYRAFENFTNYYAEKNITVHVEYESPNNTIPWELGEDEPFNVGMQKEIEETYHDYNETHVYLLITKPTEMDGQMGGSQPEWGAAVFVYKSHPNVAFLVERSIFHEIGHCIGVGLHDDETFHEVYCDDINCVMGEGRQIKYCDECWKSVLAEEGLYNPDSEALARLWNKWSVDEPIPSVDSD